jgi:hypothetical protein
MAFSKVGYHKMREGGAVTVVKRCAAFSYKTGGKSRTWGSSFRDRVPWSSVALPAARSTRGPANGRASDLSVFYSPVFHLFYQAATCPHAKTKCRNSSKRPRREDQRKSLYNEPAEARRVPGTGIFTRNRSEEA